MFVLQKLEHLFFGQLQKAIELQGVLAYVRVNIQRHLFGIDELAHRVRRNVHLVPHAPYQNRHQVATHIVNCPL